MIAYPMALTNKNWQKNKGLFAKAKPTGIGETLTALEKAYAAGAFGADADKMGAETLDPLSFTKKYEQYGKALVVHGKKLSTLAGASQAKIKAARTTFAGNKAVLSVLTDLDGELEQFTRAVAPDGRTTKALLATVKADYAKNVKASSAFKVMFDKGGIAQSTAGHVQSVLADIKKLEADPRLEKINELWGTDGPARTLRTTPVLWDQVLTKAFPQTTAAIRAGSAAARFHTGLKWIAAVGNEPGRSATKEVEKMATTMPVDKAITTFCLAYSNDLFKYQDFAKDLLALQKAVQKAAS